MRWCPVELLQWGETMTEPAFQIEQVNDPVEVERCKAQHDRGRRNSDCLKALWADLLLSRARAFALHRYIATISNGQSRVVPGEYSPGATRLAISVDNVAGSVCTLTLGRCCRRLINVFTADSGFCSVTRRGTCLRVCRR